MLKRAPQILGVLAALAFVIRLATGHPDANLADHVSDDDSLVERARTRKPDIVKIEAEQRAYEVERKKSEARSRVEAFCGRELLREHSGHNAADKTESDPDDLPF